MFKKLFYIGLGVSIIVIKKSVNFLKEKGEKAEEQIIAVMDVDDGEDLPGTAEQPDNLGQRTEEIVVEIEVDDLTQIKGIGPTYAKRLRDAGITTFEALSESSAEELRAVTKATGKTADPESWKSQAGGLA